jgi:type VI protein secretion system component Hcp
MLDAELRQGGAMTDREKDDATKDEQREPEDLDVPTEEAEDVKGGKVVLQDFSFVKKVDKASP